MDLLLLMKNKETFAEHKCWHEWLEMCSMRKMRSITTSSSSSTITTNEPHLPGLLHEQPPQSATSVTFAASDCHCFSAAAAAVNSFQMWFIDFLAMYTQPVLIYF